MFITDTVCNKHKLMYSKQISCIITHATIPNQLVSTDWSAIQALVERGYLQECYFTRAIFELQIELS